MSKTMTLFLGGKDRILTFGKMGFLTHIKEVSGKDPLEWMNSLSGDDGIIKNIADVAIIVYAGINTSLDMDDKENVDFTKVSKWVNGLDTDVMATIISSAFNAFTTQSEEKKTEEG